MSQSQKLNLKQEFDLTGVGNRVHSPYTYYNKFNRINSERDQYYKTAYHEKETWGQSFMKFTKVEIPKIFQEHHQLKEQKKKGIQVDEKDKNFLHHIVDQSDEDESVHYAHYQQDQDPLLKQTLMLKNLISVNNKQQTSLHKLDQIQKNEDVIGFISNEQRKYYSPMKQQMDEIFQSKEFDENGVRINKMSKELLDRQGLSLRQVLSSIPIEQLQQMISMKDKYLRQVIESMKPISEQYPLSQKLTPQPSNSCLQDFYNSSLPYYQTLNKFKKRSQASTQRDFGKQNNSRQNIGMKDSRNTSPNAERDTIQTQRAPRDAHETGGSQQFQQKDNINFALKQGKTDVVPLPRDPFGQHRSLANLNQIEDIRMQSKNNFDIMKEAASMSNMSNGSKKVPDMQKGKQFTHRDLGKIQQDNLIMDDYDLQKEKFQNGGDNIDGSPKPLRVKQEKEILKTLELRSSQNKNLIKLSLEKKQNEEAFDKIKKFDFAHMPQENLKQMLFTSDQATDLQQLSEDQNVLKTFEKLNTKNNFFDYNQYFYTQYSQQNQGVKLFLSNQVQKANQQFEDLIKNNIQYVDHFKLEG